MFLFQVESTDCFYVPFTEPEPEPNRLTHHRRNEQVVNGAGDEEKRKPVAEATSLEG